MLLYYCLHETVVTELICQRHESNQEVAQHCPLTFTCYGFPPECCGFVLFPVFGESVLSTETLGAQNERNACERVGSRMLSALHTRFYTSEKKHVFEAYKFLASNYQSVS